MILFIFNFFHFWDNLFVPTPSNISDQLPDIYRANSWCSWGQWFSEGVSPPGCVNGTKLEGSGAQLLFQPLLWARWDVSNSELHKWEAVVLVHDLFWRKEEDSLDPCIQTISSRFRYRRGALNLWVATPACSSERDRGGGERETLSQGLRKTIVKYDLYSRIVSVMK